MQLVMSAAGAGYRVDHDRRSGGRRGKRETAARRRGSGSVTFASTRRRDERSGKLGYGEEETLAFAEGWERIGGVVDSLLR
jgi:hypothetical protein